VYNITYIYNILESEMIYSMINNAARSLLCEQFIANNTIDPKLYDRYVVKRGLRKSDGTGVMAGVYYIFN